MPISGDSPLTINFTDTSTEGPTEWDWEFVGGTPATSTAQNPTSTFYAEGDHIVRLTPSNSMGAGSTKTDIVTVEVEAPSTVTLTIDISGDGSVTGAGSHTEGSNVAITASAATGFEFDAWFGSDESSIANTDHYQTTILMDGNKSIQVFFAPENGGGS